MVSAAMRISSPFKPLFIMNLTLLIISEHGQLSKVQPNELYADLSDYLCGGFLEPEVHIVERYMQMIKKCFTMTNIMLKGGKEIDLLAFNPITKEKFHIEVRIATGRGLRLRLIDSQTKKGRKHRRGLDTLNEIKFMHPTVVNGVREIFGSGEYKKVLVVWDVQDSSVIEQAKILYDIEVWKISNIISELMREVKSKAYRDDVLRTIQLISKKANSTD